MLVWKQKVVTPNIDFRFFFQLCSSGIEIALLHLYTMAVCRTTQLVGFFYKVDFLVSLKSFKGANKINLLLISYIQ